MVKSQEHRIISVSKEDLQIVSGMYTKTLERVEEKRRIVNNLKKFAHNLSILRKNNRKIHENYQEKKLKKKLQVSESEKEPQRKINKIFIENSMGIFMPSNFSYDSLPILKFENYRSEFFLEF